MLTDELAKYAWVRNIEAWTVSVVEGRTPENVIHDYGGDPRISVGKYTFEESHDLQGRGEPDPLQFHLQIVHRNWHVVTIENNGWSGSVPEIARRCSANGGRFFSVYWNVNAFGTVCQAIDGKVTAYFESLYPFSPEPPQLGEVRPRWAIGPECDLELAWQTCMVLMEQQTRFELKPEWVTNTMLPTYRIPDPDIMLRDVHDARQP